MGSLIPTEFLSHLTAPDYLFGKLEKFSRGTRPFSKFLLSPPTHSRISQSYLLAVNFLLILALSALLCFTLSWGNPIRMLIFLELSMISLSFLLTTLAYAQGSAEPYLMSLMVIVVSACETALGVSILFRLHIGRNAPQ